MLLACGRCATIGFAALAFHGCAALPLAVVAGSLLDAGGGVLVKTGTEYTASGTARRTFNLPVEEVHTGVLEAFTRAQIAITRDETTGSKRHLLGRMQDRTVRVALLALTPSLTSMELDVKRNAFASDKATASELLAATERVLHAHEPVMVASEGEGAGSAVIVVGDGDPHRDACHQANAREPRRVARRHRDRERPPPH